MTKITVPKDDGWVNAFAEAASRDERDRAIEIIEARVTAHAGTANASDKRAAAKALFRVLAERPADLVSWARWLAARDSATARELAAVVLTRTYASHQEEAAALLRQLCDDANWEVREWAGSAAGELLNQQFDELYPVVEGWASDPSQFVRRGVAIAVMGAADARRPERCEPLFRLIEPLVFDRAEEVRRNVGPFAVGAMLLRRYPEETITRVRRWAQSEDEMARWNAAMVFVAAEAKNHVEAALEILSALARDHRRLVWMAVSSAARNLVKRDPDRVAPALRAWLADDRKLPAALALRSVRYR